MSIHNRIHASIINKYGKKIRNKQRGIKKRGLYAGYTVAV